MTPAEIEKNIYDLLPGKRLVSHQEWALMDTWREMVLKQAHNS
jgi:hypothetical protein